MCPLDFLYPGGGFSPVSKILNATPIFNISKLIESCQKVFLFLLSIYSACLIDVGISIPHLCVDFLVRKLTLEIIISQFLSVNGTHQAKAVSSCMLRAVIYSATSIGLDSFKSLSDIQVVVPSFHFTRNFHPTVVCRIERLPLLETIHLFFFSAALLSLEWSKMPSSD